MPDGHITVSRRLRVFPLFWLSQVFNCFTDMVEDAGIAAAPTPDGQINVRFRRLQPEEDPALATCNILVSRVAMPCCRVRHSVVRGPSAVAAIKQPH